MILGYLLAGGSNLLFVGLWALWGVLYHAWGFLQNNLRDYQHDKADPSKQNFPLVKGVVSYRLASKIDDWLFALTVVMGVVLGVGLAPGLGGGLFLLTGLTFGTLYNKYSKRSLLAPFYISLAFSSLPLISYFATTSRVTLSIVLLWAYVFFLMMWQISYSGYLKDIDSDKVNLLRKLGMGIVKEKNNGTIHLAPSRRTELYGYFLRLSTIFLLVPLITLYSPILWVVLAELLLTFIMLSVGADLVFLSGIWDHHRAVMKMALVEILVYYSLVVALTGLLGMPWVIFLLAYPTVWFSVFNRIAWKTVVTPRV